MSYAALYKGTTPIISLAAGSGGGSPWVRNPAWLTLPVLGVSDQRMVGLLAITNDDSNYIALSCAGNYTVDWGDGVTENFTSGAVAQHLYTYSAISASTEYTIATGVVARQVIVSVTPQAGSNLTTVDFQQKHTRTNLQTYNSNWLDIAVNSPNMSSLILGHATTNVTNLGWVEKVNVGVIGTVTSFNFRSFRKLKNVIISNTINFSSTVNMFNGCNSLVSVPLINTATVTDMTGMFLNCRNLKSVPLFNTSNVTTMIDMFSGCVGLESIPLFNTGAVTDMTRMFLGCSSIVSIPLINLLSVVITSNMFANCFSLESLPLFQFGSSENKVVDARNMFQSCTSLKNIPPFIMSIGDRADLMFSSCISLQSVPITFSGTFYNRTSMFSGCTSLVYIKPIPTYVDAGGFTSMFLNCSSLASASMLGVTKSHSFANCKLARTALVDIFTNLGTSTPTGEIITITGNHGVADLTAADRLIATNKGWTITS